MFDTVRRLASQIKVKETPDEIIITGFDGRSLARDISKYWRTNKIAQNMFNTVSFREISFYKFFAPEVYYILDALKNYKYSYTSIKSLNKLREELMEHTWLKNTKPVDPATVKGRLDFSQLKLFNFVPEEYQMEYFENYNYRLNQYDLKGDLTAAAAGTGKAQPLTSKIKVPGGWKLMGDIQVGDVITAWDGGITVVTGVYPQGKKLTMTITFEDGRSTKACLEHLWKVYCPEWEEGWRIVNTAELFGLTEKELYIPLNKSEKINNTNLPLHPEIIGNIYAKDELEQYSNVFKNLGFGNLLPEVYLNGSHIERYTLLKTLMSVNGLVENNQLYYVASNKDFAIQVQYLVRSLGGKASVNYIKGNHRVTIEIDNSNELMSGLETTQFNNLLKITDIKKSTKVECQCISVDHADKLYITDDFIVTHNTFMGTAIAEMLHSDVTIIVCENRAVLTVWVPSMNEMFKVPPKVWHTNENKPYKGEPFLICHYQAQERVIELIRKGVFNNKKVTVLVDESHNMNDPNSLQSQRFQEICKSVNTNNTIFLSGTPVKALGTEIVTILRVIDPLFIPAVEERFKKIYGKEATKGLDIIQHRMGIISYKIEKKELNIEPPKMIPYPVKIPNSNRFTLDAIKKDMEAFIKERYAFYAKRKPQDEAYWDKLMKIHEKSLKTKTQKDAFMDYLRLVSIVKKNPDPRDVGEEIKETNRYEKQVIEPTLPRADIHSFRDVKSVIKYVGLKIQGEALGRVLGAKRIECHVAMVPYIDWIRIVESTDKKTIMFTSFVEALEEAERFTTKLGLSPITVYGKTNSNLKEIVERFGKEEKLNPLLATYASLATAVRLTMANVMITLNSPFRHYILEQAISRIYRHGQDEQTYVYQCTLDTDDVPNISTRSNDILKWSQAMVEAIMGIKSPFEITDAFEDFKEQTEFDENQLMFNILQKSFEHLDIDINKDDFIVSKVIKNYRPAFMA